MPIGLYVRSEEQKRKISLALKGRPKKAFSEEHKNNLRLNHKGLSGKNHSEETKRKISLKNKGRIRTEKWIDNLRISHIGLPSPIKGIKKPYMSGDKHPMWKGGITPINRSIRSSMEYRQWREQVFKRDDFTCQFCGRRGRGDIHADHIKPFALYPSLRLDLSNGRTLCKPCHLKTETYGWRPYAS